MQCRTQQNMNARALGRVCMALAVVMLVLHFPAIDDRAFAQETRSTGGLFQLLFGKRKDSTKSDNSNDDARKNAARRKSSGAAPVESKPKVEKLENARQVLVIGDFMAGGVAEGLQAAFSELPGVVVVDRSNGSSGLVRDDYYDWPGSIGAMIEELNPAAVAVMIGANDRQQLRVDDTSAAVRSDSWSREYKHRVERLARAIAERKVPLIWIGALPFRFSSMSADMLVFNDLYKQEVKNVGGEFVDVWEGFVDENGAFATTGPDINGQAVRLRASDGINLTRAGRRKIAFYAEKPLKRILGDAASPDIARLSPDFLPEFTPDLVPSGPAPVQERTVPISLVDPELDGGNELLGRVAVPGKDLPETPLAGERLAVEGIAPPPKPGRADDFLQRKLPPAAPSPDTEAAPASPVEESVQ